MKKTLLLLTVLLISFNTNAQKKNKIKGNKNVVLDERTFGHFTKIELNDKIKLNLKQGRSNKLEIEADENLHDIINSDFEDGTLILSLSKRITSSKKLNLTLYLDDLDFIKLNNDSKIVGFGKFSFFDIEIILNNSADIDLEFETQNFKLEANDRSRGEFSVKADSISLFMKESSKLKYDLNTEKLLVDYLGNSTGEFVGKTNSLTLIANDNATFKGSKLVSNNIIITALNKTDSYINCKKYLEITAKNKAKVYIFNRPEITIKALEDNSSILKRESMKLLENL